MEIDTSGLATSLALEVADHSKGFDMLDLVLELGKYPRVGRGRTDETSAMV